MPINNSIDDLHPDLKLCYQEAKAEWKADKPAGPWPELNETARSEAVQDAYYARSRQPVAVVQELYRKAGLYAIDAKEAAQWATDAFYGKSAHNAAPDEYADAFDVRFRVYVKGQAKGITWEAEYFTDFSKYMLRAAKRLLAEGKIGEMIVWGGDWNGNGLRDERRVDPPHYERKSWRRGRVKKP